MRHKTEHKSFGDFVKLYTVGQHTKLEKKYGVQKATNNAVKIQRYPSDIGLGSAYAVTLLLVHFAPMPFSNKYVAQVGGVLAGLVFNFTLSRIFVFKKRA